MQPLGIYIHWPYCLKRCPYCDYNVHIRQTQHVAEDTDTWITAFTKALSYYARHIPASTRQVTSIFFGGGTPSLMHPTITESIIQTVKRLFPVADDLEVTLEANPTSAERQKFQDFKTAGVNRLSLGLQSLDDQALRFLGRDHSAAEGLDALETAYTLFDRVSFDLIYALPDQTLDSWKKELSRALDYAKGHLSVYQLTIEPGTPFYKKEKTGRLIQHDDITAAGFFEITHAKTAEAGLPMYEVSNHAAPGHKSRQNMLYWRYSDFIGIGPGAHGRITMQKNQTTDYCATQDYKNPDQWLRAIQTNHHGVQDQKILSAAEQAEEAVMMGLRLVEGINWNTMESRFGIAQEQIIDKDRLAPILKERWIIQEEQSMRLSLDGFLRLNAILASILR